MDTWLIYSTYFGPFNHELLSHVLPRPSTSYWPCLPREMNENVEKPNIVEPWLRSQNQSFFPPFEELEKHLTGTRYCVHRVCKWETGKTLQSGWAIWEESVVNITWLKLVQLKLLYNLGKDKTNGHLCIFNLCGLRDTIINLFLWHAWILISQKWLSNSQRTSYRSQSSSV